jgi:hypothetical protein
VTRDAAASSELAPRGLVKLLTPLVAHIGQRQEEAIWAGLKHCLEEQETPPAKADKAGGQTR